jgi:PAS domain S-box-containing protein
LSDRSRTARVLRVAGGAAAYGLVYLAAEWLGITFYFEPGHIGTFWPASGVFLAALLLTPPRVWPAIVLATLVAVVAREASGLGPQSTPSWLSALANTFEALVGAAIVRSVLHGERPELSRMRVVLALVFGAALFATALGAALGAAILVLENPTLDFVSIWQVWWFGDALGVLAVAPAALAWLGAGKPRVAPPAHALEGAILVVGLLVSAALVFGADPGPADSVLDFPYVVVPFMFWAAWRFDARAVSSAALVTAFIAVACTGAGLGPFVADDHSSGEQVMALQAFLVVNNLAALVVFALASAERRSRTALGASERRFRSLVETTPDWVWEVDGDLRFTYSSPRVRDLLGYDPEEMLGRSVRDTLAPEERERMREELGHRMAEPALVARATLVQLRKDGGQVVTETNAAPVRDADGEVVGYRGIDRDVTARVRAEEEAALQRRQLMEADKMVALGTLVSGVAHEVNNPNHFIMLNVPVLQRAWEDARPVLERHAEQDADFRLANIPFAEMRQEIPDLLGEILAGTDRIKAIVSELRDYSRPEVTTSMAAVDVNQVVRGALKLLANPIAKATRHFEVGYGEDLPLALGSVRRLEQVLINLVLNALQALPDPDRRVSLGTRFDPTGPWLVIEVTDAGCGIPPDALDHIRDPFYTTRRDSGGTGLGLAVSSRIVEEHRGRLDFESEVGVGTTARLSVPVATEEQR